MKFEIRKIQIARRMVQVSVVLLMLLIPAVARYANYVAAREIDGTLESWDGTLQGRTLVAIDTAFRTLPAGEKPRVGQMVRDREQVVKYTGNFRGGPWSAQIGSVSMSDPLGAAESVIARNKVVAVVLISVIVPVAATVILGRVFCSWICPVGFMLELSDKLRGALRFLEIRPRDLHFSRGTKVAVLAVGFVTAAVTAAPVLSYIYPPAIMSREAHDLVFGMFDRAEEGKFGFWTGGLTWMSLILLGIVAFEVFVSRRWWCRYVCPGGAIYSGLGALRPVRVKLIANNCTHCANCVKACPMGLNPMLNRMGPECDNCGECISHCHDDALKYALTVRDSDESQPIFNRPVSSV